MTEKLKKAFDRAIRLPDDEQDVLADMILLEIEDESRWDATFKSSHHVMERLADEAAKEDDQGLTEELDSDHI